MAPKSQLLEDLLKTVSTSRSRSAVTLAAVSFAVCHLVAMITGGAPIIGGVGLEADIPRQLIHFAAELCRFLLPLGFMLAGFTSRRAAR